jgi:hypothetical protein
VADSVVEAVEREKDEAQIGNSVPKFSDVV